MSFRSDIDTSAIGRALKSGFSIDQCLVTLGENKKTNANLFLNRHLNQFKHCLQNLVKVNLLLFFRGLGLSFGGGTGGGGRSMSGGFPVM